MPSSQAIQSPNYLSASVTGFMAAFVLMPIRPFLIELTYSNGNYDPWQIAVICLPIVVALAVRLGARAGGDRRLALLSATITMLHVIGSQYLVANTLLKMHYAETGLGAVPRLLPLGTMVEMYGLYVPSDPTQLLLLIYSPLLAVIFAIIRDLAILLPFKFSRAASTPVAEIASPSRSTKGKKGTIESSSLGIPFEVYTSSMSGSVIVGIVLRAVATMLLINPIFFSGSMPLQLIFIGAGLLYLGAAIFYTFEAVANLNDEVTLYKSGVSVTHRGEVTLLRWKDITDIRPRILDMGLISTISIHEYALEGPDGSGVKIGNTYPRIREMGAVIQTAVEQTKRPKTRKSQK